MFRGEIPDGIDVLHTCDVPSCVNPEHLWLGTHIDNMRDMARKQRGIYPSTRGEDCSWAKITDEQAAEIKTGVLSNLEYAAKFHITKQHVSEIKRGIKWKHVTPPFVKKKPPQTEAQAKHATYMRGWYARRRAKNARRPDQKAADQG